MGQCYSCDNQQPEADSVAAALAASRRSEALHLERTQLVGPLDERTFDCGTHVEEVWLQENLIDRIPDRRELLEGWGNVRLLYLSSNNLPELPLSIYCWKNLEELNVSHNPQLAEIPDAIGECRALRTLYLDGLPQLRSLPIGLADCSSLSVLHANGSGLEQLPDEIFKLEGLQQVSLNGNSLKRLPSGLQNWKKVDELFLNGNNLEELPNELGQMVSLRKLWLVENRLQTLPTSIGDLENLEELYAAKNAVLKLVPWELSRCPRLKKVYFDGCDLRKFPKQVLSPPREPPVGEELKMAQAVVADALGEEAPVDAIASDAIAEPIESVTNHADSADDLKWGPSSPKGSLSNGTVTSDGGAEEKRPSDGARRFSGTWFAAKVINTRLCVSPARDANLSAPGEKFLGIVQFEGGPSALSLEVVSINDNKLTTLNVDFSKMPNLKALHLRKNQLQKINIRSLLNVPGLRVCELDENPFLVQDGAKMVYKQVKDSIEKSVMGHA